MRSDAIPTPVTEARASCLLSISEAAAHLRVTRRTVYHWLQAGKLKVAGRTPGGAIRIAVEDLVRMEESRGGSGCDPCWSPTDRPDTERGR